MGREASGNWYRIGQIARRSGLTPDALRYYERLGLLPHPPRTQGRFRLYTPATLERVHLIRSAQALGLTLQEIHELLTYLDRRDLEPPHRLREVVAATLSHLDTRLAELQALRRTLRGTLRHVEDGALRA